MKIGPFILLPEKKTYIERDEHTYSVYIYIEVL